MRRCNPRLQQFRKRRQSLLPQITRMALAGASCREIAAQLGLSKSTIHHWLQKLRQEEDVFGLSAGLSRIAGRNPWRYDTIFRRAIRAWDRSQADRKVRTVERTAATDAEGAASKKKKTALRRETHMGKAAFLAKALEALKALDKLQAAKAAARTEAQTPETQPSECRAISISSLDIEDFRHLSNEQFDALAARLLARYGEDAITPEAPQTPPKPAEGPQPNA